MRSWGGLPKLPQREIKVEWRDELQPIWQAETLPVGCGRSYGDSGLAASGIVLNMCNMKRFLHFDADTGVFRCEAGATLGEIMQVVVPQGWMLPVLPGTQFVTLGGAVANDIHGKNHHFAGTIGCHLREMGLLRSNGDEIICSPNCNNDWFSATIGGLGLTGVILWVELQLRKVEGPWLESETVKFQTLAEFFELSRSSTENFEYVVSWVDCLSRDMRGHLTRANHSNSLSEMPASKKCLGVPIDVPFSPINRYTLQAFNSAYFHRQRSKSVASRKPWNHWYFPLDAVAHWNRLYGRAGFRQYQCVVVADVVGELLKLIREAGDGSFLCVLKVFGDILSPGLLSFPRPGVTLALDFPWRGRSTVELFKKLDEIVFTHGGAIYPAKDAHMSGADFRAAFPAWEQLEKMRDPKIKSLFWQRVMEGS